MKRLAPLALIAALALTGCVSAEPSAESETAPGVQLVSATGASDDLASWADEMHTEWVDFYKDLPNVGSSTAIYVVRTENNEVSEYTYANNLEWRAPSSGHLEIKIQGNDWNAESLSNVSDYVMGVLGEKHEKLVKVTAVSEDGSVKHASTRADI